MLGAPTLKLRGDYLAIVTISAAEIIRYVGRSSLLTDFTGAAQGLQGKSYRDPFTNLSFFGDGTLTLSEFNYLDVADGAAWLRVLLWLVALGLIGARGAAGPGPLDRQPRGPPGAIAASVVLFVASCCSSSSPRTTRTPASTAGGCASWPGCSWRSRCSSCSCWCAARGAACCAGIREDEDAIRSLGKNVFAIKMQALVIGGLFGALGGMLYVLPSSVQPDSMGRSLTFFCYTALLIGGAATIFGPVLGAIIFYSARIMIKGIANGYVPDSIMNGQQTEQFSFIVVGVALMLIVIFRPQGILGDKRELRFNV